MSETIGFIGLGLMGRPMAKNLLKAGYKLVVNSRSQGPVDDLVSSGAARAITPADVARQATRIITMVPDSPDVELVLDGPNGVFTALQPGTIVIDMSSIAPGRGAAARGSRRVARRDDARRARSAAATSAPSTARSRSWSAATPRRLRSVKPILDVMGNPEKVVHIGEAGCRAAVQAVQPDGHRRHAGRRRRGARARAQGGRGRGKVREALLGGFAQSRVLEVHGDRALKGTFKPGFKTHLFAKDMRNVVATLAEHETPRPVTAVVQQLLHATMAAGRGEDDNSIMAKTVFEMAGLEVMRWSVIGDSSSIVDS